MVDESDRTQRLSALYRDVILRHAVKPFGFNTKFDVTHRAERNNPLCGDHIVLSLGVKKGVVENAAFSGATCAICTASASLLCKNAPGLDRAGLQAALAGFSGALYPPSSYVCPDYLKPMLGVKNFPARIACATLPWEAAVGALGHAAVS